MPCKNNRTRVGDRVTIYPRGKKRIFCADFWHDGKHRRQSLRTRNFKVARQRAIKLEADLQEGQYRPAPQRKPIHETIEAFLSHLETEDRQPKTLVRYRGILGVFRDFSEQHGVVNVAQITPELVDEYRAERKKILKPKSMLNEGTLLKGFLKWCVQRGILTTSPIANMTFSRPTLVPRGGPSLGQIEKILTAAKYPRRAQFSVLAFTGMRSGELQRLRLEDVDLKGNWIHIVSRDGARTKTGHSRKVPIHPRLRPHLETLTKRRRPWLFTAPPSKKYPDGDHHISTKHLNEDLLTILKKLDIPAGRDGGFTTHSLRHSFEAISVNAGIPQRVIDTWLGHQSDRSMASVYYRLSDEESQAFMKKVPFGTGEPAADAGKS